jgi:hypothetical protein
MNPTKVIIEVTAGVMLDVPMPEYTKTFELTSEDFKDEDGVMKKYQEAALYMFHLWNPNHVNWVNNKWIWL